MSNRPDIGNMEVWRELGTATDKASVKAYKEAKLIKIDKVKPNPNQPRKTFDEGSLEELADSIRDKGILQPIVVRPSGDEFIIIAGHRRRLACEKIGMQYIPSVIRDVTEQDALEQSLIENVQREDVDPVEEAICYRQLMTEHDYSIRDMADKVHKSVGYIHSRLGLLKHEDIAQSVQTEKIGIFEARELSKVKDEETRKHLTEKVTSGKLNRHTLRQAVRVATGQAEPKGEATKEEVPEGAESSHPTGVEQDTTARVATSDKMEGGGSTFNQAALYARWGVLKQDLVTLDMDSLAEKQRSEARRFLEAIRDTIEEILKS